MSNGAPNSERSRSQGPGLLFRGDRQGVCRSEGGRGSRNPQGSRGRSRSTQFRRARLGVISAVKRSGARQTEGQRRRERNSKGEPATGTRQWGSKSPARHRDHKEDGCISGSTRCWQVSARLADRRRQRCTGAASGLRRSWSKRLTKSAIRNINGIEQENEVQESQ